MTAFSASAHLDDEAYRARVLDNVLTLAETHELGITGLVIHTARTLDDLVPAAMGKSAGLPRTEKALAVAAKAKSVARPSPGGSGTQASATAGIIGTVGSLAESALPGAVELGGGLAIAAALLAFVDTLLHPLSAASDDTIYDAEHPYGPNVFSKPPKDDKKTNDPRKDGQRSDAGPREDTPSTHPESFEPVRGRDTKRNKKTGESWEKDRLHKDHYEVYKDRRRLEKEKRDRDVWLDGRPKRNL